MRHWYFFSSRYTLEWDIFILIIRLRLFIIFELFLLIGLGLCMWPWPKKDFFLIEDQVQIKKFSFSGVFMNMVLWKHKWSQSFYWYCAIYVVYDVIWICFAVLRMWMKWVYLYKYFSLILKNGTKGDWIFYPPNTLIVLISN